MRAQGWVLDLDGVVRLGTRRIAGASEAIAVLRAAGHRVVFATNNSRDTIAAVEAQLSTMGIPARESIVSSATAAATLLEPDERVLVSGGPGVVEAVNNRGAVVVDDGPVDTVMVGYHPEFDYEEMTGAVRAVLAGARLLATNDDITFPTPEGLAPGAGAILASIVTATGAEPVVAGKPHLPMARAITETLAGPDEDGPGPDVVVGDRADTDGALAVALGVSFVLVLSGVADRGDEPTEPPPLLVAEDLAAAVAQLVPMKPVQARL